MHDIETIEHLIEEMGGPTKMGAWLGISQEAVSAFKVRGVPPGWHVRILAEMRRRGKSLNPDVLGISDDDARVLFPRPLDRSKGSERPAA